MRLQTPYVWLVFVSAMDLMLTWIILHKGGIEANVLAAWIIHHYDLVGVVIFKFGVMTGVILISEWIARHNLDTARKFAIVAVALSAVPIIVGFRVLSRLA